MHHAEDIREAAGAGEDTVAAAVAVEGDGPSEGLGGIPDAVTSKS